MRHWFNALIFLFEGTRSIQRVHGRVLKISKGIAFAFSGPCLKDKWIQKNYDGKGFASARALVCCFIVLVLRLANSKYQIG